MINQGTVIDKRYRIEDVIGEGGMGLVYSAYDKFIDERVAIKFLKVASANSINVKRFENEARAMAALNHQNIISILNIGQYEDRPYMVTELIHGNTLDVELETRIKFTYIEALDIMDQLCQAIIVTHDAGVIHADIKPSNIYIMADGTIKLGDFGIAASIEQSTSDKQSETIIGSTQYLAPEVCLGHPNTVQSDIYSLCVTFFQLITGRVPFDGRNNLEIATKQVKEPFPSIKKYISSVPPKLEKVIYKGVKKNPAKRYKSVKELHEKIIMLKENPKYLKPHYSIWVRWFGFATDD
ncbi:MAG: serine/threonine-protein kinase [Bacilli bacterium]|jgi:serine/threonine protein kinase